MLKDKHLIFGIRNVSSIDILVPGKLKPEPWRELLTNVQVENYDDIILRSCGIMRIRLNLIKHMRFILLAP